MSEFIFLHGKNPDISLAEIVSYLEARSIPLRIIESSETFAVIAMESISPDMIGSLGGTIKIGEVLFSTNRKDIQEISKEIEKRLDFKGLFKNLPDKTVFGVSSYNRSSGEQKFLSDFFKNKMKSHGIKPGYIHLPKSRPALTHVEVIKKHLADQSIEFLACGGDNFYLGRTLFVHNPFEFQKRDIKRPAQRPIFSIPPRLCRIMINMSGVKEGVLLDPFCGIGSILQEAALMGFDIRGIDIDKKCISDCLENLSWLKKEYGIEEDFDKKIRLGDARELTSCFETESIDAIVTEPYLGPPLKEKPNYIKAKQILEDLEDLYEKSISGMIKILKPNRRIVIVTPSFKTEKGILRLDIGKISSKFGAAAVDPLEKYGAPHQFPFLDFEERHKTLRQINIIEKPEKK
ncbi:MAG: hypothetical protein COY38_01235 [Candidatus Aenigmarchaeota archaeon CG_4_10_14_0_8_um_filter_37_24]|nr:methyltransferase domain-containing protein [Candidatus Aenigmarchaeota archaeon]OIN88365.1 MAG: hypothetical protein AUJ50_01175 [Candidatus Aenigmarchaeota archaeon CG1_02_38_14]PIW40825.1 MAG: hypothetical protein COW21_05110 [Candidatus Aenigmarchaeota archaeon CG15_BIG_FIL_POST_REV_8_21_14_020_37_27]PIX50485.1 MAG: hypothetical protein COZ52_03765 [Candidatus Aenigmarchaeota archaeon CG_4_8_14_3_um_filter_37_24]PIY35607.1 MAG: hypothetical protein COZ04_02870 [Candidatus Aenigmarchaeota